MIGNFSKKLTALFSKEKYLFDEGFYKIKNLDLKAYEGKLYNHYKDFGRKEGRMPHPLFDPIFYRKMYLGDKEINPIKHYFDNQGKGLNPHPLFDCEYYMSQLTEGTLSVTPLEHFLTIGWKKGISPSPYFDVKYYLNKYKDVSKAEMNPLIHYLTYGEEEFRFPNSTFDPKEYLRPPRPPNWNYAAFQNRSKLSFFVLRNEYGRLEVFNKIGSAIGASSKTNGRDQIVKLTGSFQEIFDGDFYLQTNNDLRSSGVDPEWHYLNHGYKEGRNPHPLVDPEYIREKYLNNDKEIEPLAYYLSKPDEDINPHPLFDTAYYKKQLTGPIEGTCLEHYLKVGWKQDLSPTKHFDVDFYKTANTDVDFDKISPLIHYLTIGEAKNLQPNSDFDPSKFEKYSFDGRRNYMSYITEAKLSVFAKGNKLRLASNLEVIKNTMRNFDLDKPIFIFVTHSASRTGAPLIILKISEYFKKKLGANCVNILCEGGELEIEFEQIGPTYIFKEYWGLGYKDNSKSVGHANELIEMLSEFPVMGAYVNSAESRRISPFLKKLRIPVISLIHEMGNLYQKNEFKIINDYSDLIVFPSKPVGKMANGNYKLENDKYIYRGQGLLKEEILKADKADNRTQLLRQLGLSSKSKIVLGCGTVDGRKGVDYFIKAAIIYFQKYGAQNTYFVWLGGDLSDKKNQFISWLSYDVENSGFEDNIIFAGKHKNTLPFFLGADIFFMTSRADPFPCVIHEAMAAQLSVVGFKGTGGFVEAVDKGCSKVVGYGDVSAAAEAIESIIGNPEIQDTMGQHALARVMDKFSYDGYVVDLAREMHSILKGNFYNDEKLNSLKTNFANSIENYYSEKPNNKNVIFTLANWQISGVNTVVENLVEYLNQKGYNAWILFTTNYSIDLDESLMPAVPYKFLLNYEATPNQMWTRLESYLEEHAPCVFFPNCDYQASAISAILPSGVGICGVLHSDDVEHYEHGYRLGRYWNKIVSVSQTVHDTMIKMNPSFEGKSSVVDNGIKVNSSSKPVKNEKFTIVYTGRVVQYQKRILDFIPLVDELNKLNFDYEFIIVGDGPEFQELEEGLKSSIASKRVVMMGRQTPSVINEVLAKSHVFILTSEFEGMPMSLLEALSWYCIPVLTDIKSGVGRIINHNENGLVSPIGDMEKFAKNLHHLSQNKKIADEMSLKAFKTLEDHGLRSQDMGASYIPVIEDIFKEIEQELFDRPEALSFNAPTGEIIIPPYMQHLS